MESFSYENKVILAPMVRVGVIPFRELCTEYGADIVYSEELVDKKLLLTKPKYNKELDIVEYISTKDRKNVVYRYRKNLNAPTVLQIGTASSEYALKCANHMYDGYDGIDVNMGCPKKFSVQGGMGVALLKDQERVFDIMKTLRRNIKKPVSCKIRIQRDLKKTIDLLKTLDGIGLDNISIHSRYPDTRTYEPALPELIKPLLLGIQTNITYNGDVYTHEDIKRLKKISGCQSVMLARGALYNASLFTESESKMEHKDEVALKIIDRFLKYNIPYQGVRYTLQRMYEKQKKTPIFRKILDARSYIEIKKAYSHIKQENPESPKKQKLHNIK